jgi:hypothetical protein
MTHIGVLFHIRRENQMIHTASCTRPASLKSLLLKTAHGLTTKALIIIGLVETMALPFDHRGPLTDVA